MTCNPCHRFRSRRGRRAFMRGEGLTDLLGVRERCELTRRQSFGIEYVAASVNQCHNGRSDRRTRARQHAHELAANLANAEQHHVESALIANAATADLVELECV